MGSVRGFILSHFGKNYALVFLPFFAILSIVYLIRISILSEKIALDAGEFLTLFGFFLPDILFFALPLSFIASLTATLIKLSEDNELIALFSFGFAPNRLLRIFLLPALLFSLLMLLLSLHTIPKSTLAYKRFKEKKTTEAKLAIAPNRLGQKFGDYMVFLGGKKGDTYQDIVLFATDDKEKRVIVSADHAKMQQKGTQASLTLYQGTADTFLPETIESVAYKQMHLYNHTDSHNNLAWLSRGWSQISSRPGDMARFVYSIFLSLSPLLVLGAIIAFSVINPRYQRSNLYLVSFSISLALYAVASILLKQGTPTMLLLVSLSFLVASTLLFYTKLKARF